MAAMGVAAGRILARGFRPASCARGPGGATRAGNCARPRCARPCRAWRSSWGWLCHRSKCGCQAAASGGQRPRPVQLAGSPRQLGEVWLEQAQTPAQRRLCADLLRAGHPLGAGRAPGCRVQYLLASRLGPVGALSFVAALLRLGPRDGHLGWGVPTGARRALLPPESEARVIRRPHGCEHLVLPLASYVANCPGADLIPSIPAIVGAVVPVMLACGRRGVVGRAGIVVVEDRGPVRVEGILQLGVAGQRV